MAVVRIASFELTIQLRRRNRLKLEKFRKPYNLHFGPGPNWQKPDGSWIAVDADPDRGDWVINFSDFERIPVPECQVTSVYGSHVFEHISPYVSNQLFREIHRVLVPGGCFRLVLPDVKRSIRAYVENDTEFPLFVHRSNRAKRVWGREYTAFDCLREDFISMGQQQDVLGSRVLAHQNAWDFESLSNELQSIGFNVTESGFQASVCDSFAFEGTYPSEANETHRSLYVDAVKPG